MWDFIGLRSTIYPLKWWRGNSGTFVSCGCAIDLWVLACIKFVLHSTENYVTITECARYSRHGKCVEIDLLVSQCSDMYEWVSSKRIKKWRKPHRRKKIHDKCRRNKNDQVVMSNGFRILYSFYGQGWLFAFAMVFFYSSHKIVRVFVCKCVFVLFTQSEFVVESRPFSFAKDRVYLTRTKSTEWFSFYFALVCPFVSFFFFLQVIKILWTELIFFCVPSFV